MTFFACFLMVAGMVTAQTQRVTGVVTSAADGEPIIGASVGVKGTTIGAITDVNGKFEISSVPATARTLVVSYVGMATKEVAIRPNVTVELEEDAEVLEEVIVQAFGTAKKSAFTGSAAVVSADKIAESQATSITGALVGKVAGVQFTSSDGSPQSAPTLRIRGFSSLNAGKDPLIIVDGAPFDGDMTLINNADIDNMTILKDAASNALYGARGANGVIMITTKKAQEGNAVVTFDGKYGWNQRALKQYNIINNPAMFYETHYAAMRNYYLDSGMSEYDAWVTANTNICGEGGNGGLGYNVYTYPKGQMLIGIDGKLNPNATLGRVIEGTDYYVTPDDWESAGYRTGIRQEYNVNVSSANERSSFYASLGYLDNEGITYGSGLKRLSGRLRADYKANNWLKVGGNTNFTKYDSDFLTNAGSSTSSGNIWAFTSQTPCIYPLYIRNADGTQKYDSNGFAMMDYGNADITSGGVPGMTRQYISDANPLMDNLLNTHNSEGTTAGASGFADITFLPNLVLTLNGTYNLDQYYTTYVYNPYYGQFDSTGGTIESASTRMYTYNLQQLLNYTFTSGLYHNFNFMLGHEYYNRQYTYLGASKSQMFSQDIKVLSNAVVDGQSAYGYKTFYNNEGYFGRVQYDYDNKYFASASVRRDASSRFHPDYRWGTFWSLGGAWLINKEYWFDAGWVDELKLKASIGSQGNDNIGNYMYTDQYSLSNSAGKPAVSFDSKGTRDITWETNTNFNAGVEFSLFKRLSGGFEYFRRTTTDMLFSFTVAPSLGYSSYYDNVGDLYNEGFELELNYNIIKQKNFQWDVNLNATTLKNRITMLHEDKKTTHYYDLDGNRYDGYGSTHFVSEGLSMYTWRYKEYAGVASGKEVDPVTGESLKFSPGQSLWYYNKPVYKDYSYNTETKEETITYYALYDETTGTGNFMEDAEDNKFLSENGNLVQVYKWKDGSYYNYEEGKVPAGQTAVQYAAGAQQFQTGHTVEATNEYAKADYYVTNKSIIPDLYGGFGTSFKIYGFDLNVNFTYQIGGYQYDGTYARFMSCPTTSTIGYNYHADVLNAWTPANATSNIPRWQLGDTYSASASTRFLTSSSYLNLQNISLGYTLPASLTRKAQINTLRVYASAENLWYLSARQGFDPRQGYDAGGTNATFYSPMRTVSVGLTIVPTAGKETKSAPVFIPQTFQTEPQVVEKIVEKEVVKEVVKEVPAKKAAASADDNIYFVIGKSELRPGEAFKLGQLCQILKDNPSAKISVAGYADAATGTPAINDKLSQARAKVVADTLIEAGIDPSRITTSAAIADDRVAVCIVK